MTVLELISAHFGGANVHEGDTNAELGGDPLDCVELLVEIDEHLNIDLPDGAIALDSTVGEVVEMVEAHRREAA